MDIEEEATQTMVHAVASLKSGRLSQHHFDRLLDINLAACDREAVILAFWDNHTEDIAEVDITQPRFHDHAWYYTVLRKCALREAHDEFVHMCASDARKLQPHHLNTATLHAARPALDLFRCFCAQRRHHICLSDAKFMAQTALRRPFDDWIIQALGPHPIFTNKGADLMHSIYTNKTEYDPLMFEAFNYLNVNQEIRSRILQYTIPHVDLWEHIFEYADTHDIDIGLFILPDYLRYIHSHYK